MIARRVPAPYRGRRSGKDRCGQAGGGRHESPPRRDGRAFGKGLGRAGTGLAGILLLLAVPAFCDVQAGDIYRYTAPDGTVLYTNMPLEPTLAERVIRDLPVPPALPKASSPEQPPLSEDRPLPAGFAPAEPAGKVPAASHQIAHFPLVKQRGPWCVAAGAEMVLRYHGFPRRQDDIAFSAYDNRGSGTSLAAIARYINRIAGLRAWLRERTDFETLKRCIDRDVPVMVPLKEPGREEGHLAVAIGYDDGGEIMVLAEPATGSTIRVSYRDFLRVWTGASVTVTPTRM